MSLRRAFLLLACVGLASALAPAAAAETRASVVYGSSGKLSSIVPSERAGEIVVVLARAIGDDAYARIGRTTTTRGGAWTFAVRPRIRTWYRIRWRGELSPRVRLDVRPRVRLDSSPGRFVVRVSPNAAGKYVWLQRWNRRQQSWIFLRRVQLDAASTAVFRYRGDRRGTFRALLTRKQAAEGYLSGVSRTIAFR